MVEIIRVSKIYAEDIDWGDGTREVTLWNGQTVTMEQVNIGHIIPNLTDNLLLFPSSGVIMQDADFSFDASNNRLSVPEIAGGDGSAADLVLDSTTHATKGVVQIQPTSGNVAIGGTAAATKLHLKATGSLAARIENTDAGTAGDPMLQFAIASTVAWSVGVDDSDSDKLMIEAAATLGSSPLVTLTSTSRVGVNESAPLGTLHVKTSDAGAVTPDGGADEVIVESNGDAGVTIITPAANTGRIHFGSTTQANNGMLKFEHANTRFVIGVSNTDRIWITANGAIRMNSASNSFNNWGLTIDLVSSAVEALSIKQSGLTAHGMTTEAETDTAFTISPIANLGGAYLTGLSESTTGVHVRGYATTGNTAKGLAATAPVVLQASLKTGTTIGAHGANENLVVIRDNGLTRVIFDVDGDITVDGSGSLATYDDYDDVQLLTTVKALACPSAKVALGRFFEDNLEVLAAGGVVTLSEDGHHFISYKGLMGLFVDAIRQLAGRIERLESA